VKQLRRLFFLALIGLLAGCAATGPVFTPHREPTDKEARIYIYRPFRAVHQLGGPDIAIGERYLTTLLNKGYAVAYVPAGPSKIAAKGNILKNWSFRDVSVEPNLMAGRTYFVRLVPGLGGIVPLGSMTQITYTEELSLVDPKIAESEIAACQLLYADK
jgi:hypothetical protein